MKNRDSSYVKKIIDYCDIVDGLLDEYGNDFLIFQSTISFQLSVSMCIIQIGEYVSRLSDDFKDKNNHIPWRKIKGMRNFTTHQYENVELDMIWHTITEELPDLKNELLAINF